MSGAARQLFVVPAPHGAPSGGNRYNDCLLQSLQRANDFRALERVDGGALTAFHTQRAGAIWLDSLYLELLPVLRAWAPRTPLWLLAHALPSQLAEGAGRRMDDAYARERELLGLLSGALAPSSTMAQLLRARRSDLTVFVIEPGLPQISGAPRAAADAPRALMVANVLPHKGVLPLLGELAAQLAPADRFSLRVVGRLDADPAYAQACAALLDAQPLLAQQVSLVGALPFDALLEELRHTHIFLSASRTESFGMAIAEARAAGCVVLARAGGHVAQLVDSAAGGELLSDETQLVRAFLRLVRDPCQLRERLTRAARTPLPGRTWSEAARELSVLLRT